LKTLLPGLGNPILTPDDGVGIRVVRAIAARWTGDGVDFQEASAGGLRLSRSRLFRCDEGFFSQEMICGRIGTA